VRGREVDVSGGRVDVVVAHQLLDHGQVDPRFRQGGAEAVPQSVGVPGGDACLGAVVAEHGPQPCGAERLATVGALGDDEQLWK
jgi:hypothetical protein